MIKYWRRYIIIKFIIGYLRGLWGECNSSYTGYILVIKSKRLGTTLLLCYMLG